MPQSPSVTVVARTHFVVGELGWLTRNGVIRTLHRTPPPDGIPLVKALEDVEIGMPGRFIEVSPEGKDPVHQRA